MFGGMRNLYWKSREILGFRTKLFSYPDYESYRRIQTEGNIRKIDHVSAIETNIAAIAEYAENHLGIVRSVLCHGTRNWAELKWFKENLKGQPDILGTDISYTATQFPNTIQWDFHDRKEEWIGKWDLIFTNSWDHAFDPERAILVWLECLNS